jgi:predicted TIM-barrel fold metal-dependent hydrolase
VTPFPDGTWDCHAHVIGDPAKYPLSSKRSYDPPAAPLDAYLAFLDRRGIAHGMLVQPSVYEFDNRCMLDALDRADGRLVGVAVPHPRSTAADLEAMHRRGVRGVRCNLVNPGWLPPEFVVAWGPVLRELGWHLALHIGVAIIGDLRTYLEPFDVPVVIDHMGGPGSPLTHRGDLVQCVRDGVCFVKLSAPYRLSTEAAPWRDVTPLARALVSANAAGCVWGSDWPHTDTPTPVTENDLFVALDEWCTEGRTRRMVTEDAPRILLGARAD